MNNFSIDEELGQDLSERGVKNHMTKNNVVNWVLGFAPDISNKCYNILFHHFLPHMPYDVAKGRSGVDPYCWIKQRLREEWSEKNLI